MPVKQMIVVRHDLHMRMGKAIAQGAHAAMMFLIQRMALNQELSEDEQAWFSQGITKICVRVESAEELDYVEKRCREAGLLVHVVTDAGRTEFQGVPTKTCLAIGPAEAERIDEVTRLLKLL